MAIGDAYASVDDYKAVHEGSSVTSSQLVAVSRYIDMKMGRPSGFQKDATATVRIYMPKSTGMAQAGWAESENPWKAGGLVRVLDVEDIGGAVTSITVDEQRDNTFSLTLATSDYELLPRNAAVGPEPKPYNQIALSDWGTQSGFPPGARVKVTAIHGWPAVPEAIKWATIELVAMLLNASVFSTDRIQDIDQQVGASPQARSILNGLMTNYGRGIFF